MTRWVPTTAAVLDHRGERPEFDLSENEGGISSNGSDSGPGESGISDNEMDESMRNFYKPGSPSSWSRHHQSSRFGSMQNYTGPFPNTSDDEDAHGEEDDMGFIPETMPIDRVKWYELQKRSERSNVQGDIAISLRLSDWSFSESLRQQSKAVFVGFRCGKVAVPPDNTHIRASRAQSPHVMIKGIPISTSGITSGEVKHQQIDGDSSDSYNQGWVEDNQSTARDKKNGLVRSLSSLFRSNDGTDDSYDMLMSPKRLTQQRRHMMLYRALKTVNYWQLRVNLLGCEGVKHAGMAKDMRVTTALLAVAPPVIRWKNYVVLRLDGYENRNGHFRRQSKTVTKASGPSWNGEELVIDNIPAPLVGNVTLTLYQVIGLEIIHREVGAGSVLLNSIPRHLDNSLSGSNGADTESGSVATNETSGASQITNTKDSTESSTSWREQHDAIDVPLSLLAGLGTMSRVSNGVLRCTMSLTPSDNLRKTRHLVPDEIESVPRSIRRRRHRKPLSDAINPFRS